MINLNNGAMVFCDGCSFNDVYYIDIDEERIELNDQHKMVIGTIDINKLDDCDLMEYDEDDRLDGDIKYLKEMI